MKIAVLNGSPKGQVSVTMQYVLFLQKKFPEVEFAFFDVALKIKKLEKEEKFFREVLDHVAAADAVLWAFPLYFLVVCSQYKRFIELIFERNAQAAFRGKPAAVLTTSIKFFDYTAHNYLHAVCDDLDMNYFGSYSAEMNDLLKESERQRLEKFGALFIDAVRGETFCAKEHPPLTAPDVVFEAQKIDVVETNGKKVLIVADDASENLNLMKMIVRLQKTFSPPAEFVQLKDIDIKGGCLGCLQCGFDNVCVYEGKDDFIDFFNKKIRTADILFMAGAMKDRYLSSLWKCFFDRSFFNGHTPTLLEKQVGFIVSGPLRQNHNLQEILKAYLEIQHAGCAGWASDDMGDAAEIDAALQTMARRAVAQSAIGYVQPPTFYQVAGIKLFRDIIWSRLRVVFQADHRFYKKHGVYNFPQKKYKWRVINATLYLLTQIPFVKREFIKRMKTEMIKPCAGVVAKTQPRQSSSPR
jgi:multimeric flavodoxin WrbA